MRRPPTIPKLGDGPPAPRQAVEGDALLSIDQAATYLNVPARWVADAVRQRKVRCTRIGKHVRFRQVHLDELIAAGEQPVTTPVGPIATMAPVVRATSRSRI